MTANSVQDFQFPIPPTPVTLLVRSDHSVSIKRPSALDEGPRSAAFPLETVVAGSAVGAVVDL
jgi:hypothetical protein